MMTGLPTYALTKLKKAALGKYVVGAPLAVALYATTQIKREADISVGGGRAKVNNRATARVAPTIDNFTHLHKIVSTYEVTAPSTQMRTSQT